MARYDSGWLATVVSGISISSSEASAAGWYLAMMYLNNPRNVYVAWRQYGHTRYCIVYVILAATWHREMSHSGWRKYNDSILVAAYLIWNILSSPRHQ